MKRWQVVLIIVIVLGLITGLELNIYLRHHHRAAKKIVAIPRSIERSTVKTIKKMQRTVIHIGRTTKGQYITIAKKTSKAARSGLVGRIIVGTGGLLVVVLVGGGIVAIARRIPATVRAPKREKTCAAEEVVFDDDLPPLPEKKDPEIHSAKVAEVLRARRSVQSKREGKLSPLGGQQIRKYELTDQVASQEGSVLHRIRALVRIQNADGDIVVECGELGGYIEQESNLSHYRNAWVAEQAAVFGTAKVYGDAVVAGQAKVSDKARIYDLARVDGATIVGGTAEICGKAHLSHGTYTEGKIS
jgi:hypothetical protein